MKKLLVLFLVVLFGVSMIPFNATADNRRTIPRKYKAAIAANTVISSKGGTLYSISGLASSASCVYSVHDASGITCDGAAAPTCTSLNSGTTTNVIGEGGEASQYDSVPTLDFGPEGVSFNNGLVIYTSLCHIAVSYN